MQIGIKSLGCPKNFVDTEVICGKLKWIPNKQED
jgi:ribosomal protein S12 methylthiotransferase